MILVMDKGHNMWLHGRDKAFYWPEENFNSTKTVNNVIEDEELKRKIIKHYIGFCLCSYQDFCAIHHCFWLFPPVSFDCFNNVWQMQSNFYLLFWGESSNI